MPHHHFKPTDNFTHSGDAYGQNAWVAGAAAEAYTRGAYHPAQGRGFRQEFPENGFGDGRHQFGEIPQGEHWRSHHKGRIGRDFAGGEAGGPRSYYPQNAGFPGFGENPGFGAQPAPYGRQRQGFPGATQPSDNGWGWGQPPQQDNQWGWGQPPEERQGGRRRESHAPTGETHHRFSGTTHGGLTAGQEAFANELAAKTGLDRGVVGNWLLREESGRAAQNREAAGNHNWLNVGYTDSGRRGTGNQFWYGDPVHAADATAAWMKGELHVPGFGRASRGIREIQRAAGLSPSEQMSIIARSGWASSGYGYQYASAHRAHQNYYASAYHFHHRSDWRFEG